MKPRVEGLISSNIKPNETRTPVCEKPLGFDFLFIKLKPYPLLMPLSIYTTLILAYLLLYRWWREE